MIKPLTKSMAGPIIRQTKPKELWTPAQITTAAWLDHESFTPGVWADKKGGFTLTGYGAVKNGTTIEFPTGAVMSTNNGALLSNTGAYCLFISMVVPDPTGGTTYPIFMRINSTEVGTAARRPYLIGNNFNGGDKISFSNSSTKSVVLNSAAPLVGQAVIFENRQEPVPSGNLSLYMNGQLISSRSDNVPDTSTDLNEFRIQHGNMSAAEILRVKEIVLLTQVPDQGTTDRMTGYLAHRHGTAGSLDHGHSYKESPPYI